MHKLIVGVTVMMTAFGCGISPEVLERRSALIKNFVGYDSLVCVSDWRRKSIDQNIQAAAHREDIEGLVSDAQGVRQMIKNRLAQLPHSYASLPPELSEEAVSVDRLHREQLIFIQLLLHDLEHTALIRQIGKAFRNVYESDYFEIGGLFVFDQGDLLISPQGNAIEDNPFLFLIREFTGGYFKFSDRALSLNHVFLFHSHTATAYSPRPCGPSWQIRDESDGKTVLGFDLGAVFARLVEQGAVHHLVITMMTNRRFNIDYVGGVLHQDSPTAPDTLPVSEQLKLLVTLDLGIYQY